MATRMQQRKGTEAQWISTNNGQGPVLNAGEIGFEIDTNKFKIGDGISHWVDLNYFADAVELGGSIDDYIPLTQRGTANGVATLNADGVIPSSQIPSLVGLDTEITSAVNAAIDNLVDGAPGALNTLNEFALALANDEDFAATVTTNLGYKQDKVANVTNTNISHLEGTTSGIQAQLDAKAATADIEDLANEAIGASLVAGTGLDKSYDNVSKVTTLTIDSTVASQTFVNDGISAHNDETENIHGIVDTSKLATVDGAETLTFKTLSDPTIVVDPTGSNISISATELGYLNNVSSNIQTQINAKAASADIAVAAQDAVGGSIGTGLAYDTETNVLSVDQTTMQARVADVSDTEIGYLNGVTSAIQTQLNDKQPKVSGVSDTEIGYLDGVTSAIQTQIDSKLASSTASSTYAPLANPTFTGTVSGVTKSHVGLGNVDNTSDANKPVSTATQTALDAKASLAGATFTGSVEVDGNLVVDGDFTVNGTNFAASATSITIEDNLVQIAHTNPSNSVDLGLVVAYNDGAAKHAGIARDVSENKWKLFKGVSTEPSTVVAFGEGTLDNLQVAGFEATSATIGDVSNTELQYLNGVTSAIQTQLDAKQAIVSGVSNTEIGYLDGVTSAIQTQIDSKAPTANPTFTGTVAGVTKAHVGLGNVDNTSDANKPISTATQTALDAKANSVITIDPETASYTLVLSNREQMVEMNVSSANTLTVPTNSSVAFPVGTRIHVVQTGTGQTTLTPASGVTINGTPGLKTRAQWSAVTLVKRATDTWVAFGDLTA